MPRNGELTEAREAAYRGDRSIYNTVTELITLRESGYLIGGAAEGTPRDWIGEESASIKSAYRAGDYIAQIRRWFPAEVDEVDDGR